MAFIGSVTGGVFGKNRPAKLPRSDSRNRIKNWRRQADLNRRIAVLQTAPLTTWVCRPFQQIHLGLEPVPPANPGLNEQAQAKAWACSFKPSGRLGLGLAPEENEWSGRRGSNPRLQPWQGCTLPLSYSREPGLDAAPSNGAKLYFSKLPESIKALRSFPSRLEHWSEFRFVPEDQKGMFYQSFFKPRSLTTCSMMSASIWSLFSR
jgi:hypothetical protein